MDGHRERMAAGREGAPRGGRLFTPGFRAIVASQAFSLLGMEILQFVLPLHLLNLTGRCWRPWAA